MAIPVAEARAQTEGARARIRIGDTLNSMVPTIETYSIDGSFLNLGEVNSREVEPLARELRERVQRWVGIPTCVGIAPTKTLANVADFIAKKRPQYRGVCDLRSASARLELLSTVPVDEVWALVELRQGSWRSLESRRRRTWPHSNRTMLAL